MSLTDDDARAWIRQFTPESPLKLVCFPHAGGAATSFVPFAKALSPGIQVLAVQYPGRQDRYQEPPLESIPELADAAFEAVRKTVSEEFAFFGHSLGAVLAFEVALRFEQSGGTGPKMLFASARSAPSVRGEKRVHLRDDAGIVAELWRLSGTDQSILRDEELLAMLLPVLRADYRAVETYAASTARVSCPIAVFVGDADPVTTLDDASAWREHSTAEVDLQIFPGGHFYLDSQVDAVAEETRSRLAGRVQGTAATGRG